MAAPLPNTRFSLCPPLYTYITFSIDVAATLKLYCGGGDDAMLRKLDGLQDHSYAGYCFYIVEPDEELAPYTVITVRPVQQGLTKPHPRKPQHARANMCIPILPTTDHPRSREPFEVSKGPLPWENCYHPTCYAFCMRAPTERRDYFQSPSAVGELSLEMMNACKEDRLYRDLLSRPGLDDDRILRILDGQEEVPDTDVPDDVSQNSMDSQANQMFLAKVPGCDKLEEDYNFTPVMRIDLVLSNVAEISDPSQLIGDLDLFQEIVQEYQLACYGSAVFPQPEPEMEVTFVGNFSEESFGSGTSGTSTEDLSSESPDSDALDLSLADESHVPSNSLAPPRKGLCLRSSSCALL
ncbi:hypothetical protein EDD18DRAFT_1462651 [Armillaria luteobubalina]|uniref:Uncharacterized protein n=1 Tax=Armillaria luteobubalina TaxID=153913 RepID=A0AA39UTR2_9AGAR|nr:hypothetical protein EDD18DRAFT_1462651 [Armillaria luteobubalina]